MVAAFADNQVIVAASLTTSTIFTDPVPLNGMDRITCHFLVHYIFNPDGTGAKYTAQVSNDGTNWADSSVTDHETTADLFVLAGQAIYGAFIRFKLSFGASVSGTGACCFDLHVLLDKS